MHRFSIFSLLSIIVLITFNAGTAHAEICSEIVTANYADAEGLRGNARHLKAVAGNECTVHWTGTLARSRVSAEIQAERGLVVDRGLGGIELLVREVQEGLKIADDALVKLGIDRIIGDHINVILSSFNVELEHGRSDIAYTFYLKKGYEGVCTLVVTPRTHQHLGRPEAMAFVMAHELFHCVQNASIPNFNRTSSPWWTEGSANWFAHMAQPYEAVDVYSDYERDFEQDSPVKTLGDFSYESWPFFTWLAQHRGSAHAVMLFLMGMPESRHHSNAAIASLLTPEDWDEFAKQYSAYQIRISESVPLDPRPRVTLHKTRIQLPNINDEKEVPFKRHTGGLDRYKIILEAGDWELSTTGSGAMFLSEIMTSGDPNPDWQEISSSTAKLELSVPCDKEKSYALVGFGSHSPHDTFPLKIRKAGDPCELTCAKPPESFDTCLAGLWRETDLLIPELAENMVIKQLRTARARGVDVIFAEPVVTFIPKGSLSPKNSVATVELTGSGTANMHGQEVKIEITLGRGNATWGTSGNQDTGFKLLICPQTASIRGKATLSKSGHTQTIPFGVDVPNPKMPFVWPEGILFDYTCDETSVTLHNAEKNISGKLER